METTITYSNIQVSATADNSADAQRAYDVTCNTRHGANGLTAVENGRIADRSNGRQAATFHVYDGNMTVSFANGLTAEAQSAALLAARALCDACAATTPGIVVTEETIAE